MTASSWASLDWEGYWSRYLPYLLMTVAVFSLGLLFGSLATEVLTSSERLQLAIWLKTVVNFESSRLFSATMFRSALIANMKVLGLLYVLGISVAGIPLVLAVLFLRGFVVGFGFAFLSQSASGHGLSVLLTTVVAQNLFMVPIYLTAGTLALWFSWNLIRKDGASKVAPWKALGGYTLASSLLSVGMLWASAVEVMGSPLLLHLEVFTR